MNNIKTGTILVLAVAAMLTAACDPFPKAPGGAPAVLRAVSTGGSVGGNVEQSIDLPPDPTAVVVDDATGDANFFVWFTKEMDSRTIQAFPDFDPATGKTPLDPLLPNPDFGNPLFPNALPFLPVVDTCELDRSPLTVSANFPAGTSLCYLSGSAQGGGLIEVIPSDFLDVGTYTVGGDVKDYQGIPLTFNATFNVTHKPWLVPSDPYTIDVGWTNDSVNATGFIIERTTTADGSDPLPAAVWTEVVPNAQWAAPGTVGNNAIFRNAGLEPDTTYFYRITPVGPAGATASSFQSGTTAVTPNIKAVANPLIPDPANVGQLITATNTVQLAIGRIRSAAYRVQLKQTAPTADLDFADATAANMNLTGVVGAPALTNPVSARATNPFLFYINGLTPGATYEVRIIPEWTGVAGTPNGPGTPTNTATFTIPAP